MSVINCKLVIWTRVPLVAQFVWCCFDYVKIVLHCKAGPEKFCGKLFDLGKVTCHLWFMFYFGNCVYVFVSHFNCYALSLQESSVLDL